MIRTVTTKNTWLDRPGESYDVLLTDDSLGKRVNVHRWTDTDEVVIKAIDGDGTTDEFEEFFSSTRQSPSDEEVEQAVQFGLDLLQNAARDEERWPTVQLRILDSAIAFDERGEVIETVDFNDDGSPDWTSGGICDARGGGGQEGFKALHSALTLAEANAGMVGLKVRRIPADLEG